MAVNYCGGVVPDARADGPLVDGGRDRVRRAAPRASTSSTTRGGFGAVWDLIRATNAYIEDRQPWALNKAGDAAAAAAVLGDCLEALRVVALLASPVIPRASRRAVAPARPPGTPEDQRLPDAAGVGAPARRAPPLEKGDPLFPRIETDVTATSPTVLGRQPLPPADARPATADRRRCVAAGPGGRGRRRWCASAPTSRRRRRAVELAGAPPRRAGDRRAAPARRVAARRRVGRRSSALAASRPSVVGDRRGRASTSTTSTRRATTQEAAFRAQIRLAHELDRALVIHSREAWDDTFRVLADEGVPDAHGVPLLHRRARRGASARSTSARTSRSAGSCRSRTPTTCAPPRRVVPARPGARRDRRAVPRAGAAPRPPRTSPRGWSTSARRSPRPSADRSTRWPTPPAANAARGVRAPPLTCDDPGPAGRSLPRRVGLTTVTLRLRRGWNARGDAARPPTTADARGGPDRRAAEPSRGPRAGRAGPPPPSPRTALPAHVARAIGPSPARAEPHDADAWLPVPDPHALPSIETLLDERRRSSTSTHRRPRRARSAVAPSPARAEPHDAAAWLPLPDDLDELPPVDDAARPRPRGAGRGRRRGRGGRRRRPGRGRGRARRRRRRGPSPTTPPPGCRSPSRDALPAVTELLEEAPPPAAGTAGASRTGPCPAPRVLGIALLVVATVLGGGWAVTAARSPRPARRSRSSSTAPRHDMRTEASTVGALLTASSTSQLGAGDVVVPVRASRAARRPPRRRAARVPGHRRPRRHRAHRAHRRDAAPTAWPSSSTLGKLVAVRNQPGGSRPGSTVVLPHAASAASLMVDGQTVTFDSPSRTVDELLAVVQRARSTATTTSSPRPTPCSPTARRVTVVRVGADDHAGAREPIPFDDVQQADPDLPIGQTRVIRDGVNGTHDRHLPPADRERRRSGDRTIAVEGADGRADAADHRLRHQGRPALGRARASASRADAGTPSTPTPTATTAGSASTRHLDRVRRRSSSRPTRGLATREEQIIVGQRIYDEHGWDPWGCANNVAALAAVEHVSVRTQLTATPVASHRDGDADPGDGARAARRARPPPEPSLGQNFLADPNTARRIVAARRGRRRRPRRSRSAPASARSRSRCSTPARTCVALELDRRLAAGARAVRRAARAPTSEVEHGDALDRRPRRAARGRARAPWACVSNLPYNVAVPGGGAPARGGAAGRAASLVMVQREVGERLAAGPGDEQYGAVSVKVAYYAEARVVGAVPPTVFVPRPKVESALVRLDRRADAAGRRAVGRRRCSRSCAPASRSGARCCAASLRAGARRPHARACSTPRASSPTARAEALGLEEWAALARSAAEAA